MLDRDSFAHDETTPRGFVPTEGRGSLPFSLVHGESLVAAAAWALGAAEVELIEEGLDPDELDAPLVVHDPLCPLTPPEFIEQLIGRVADAVLVGVQAVTDTVKRVERDQLGPVVGATVPREQLMVICSPIVFPTALARELGDLRLDAPFVDLVERLAQQWTVEFVEAPTLARRVGSVADLEVLAALSRATALRAPGRRER